MSSQNPVFIPGLRIFGSVRKACDMATIDHRSPTFAKLFKPAVAGVRRVLKMKDGEVIIIPSTGTGGWKRRFPTLCRRAILFWPHGSGCSATAGLTCASATD